MILILRMYLVWSPLRIPRCAPRPCGRSRCPTPRPGCCSPPAAGVLPPAARTCQEKGSTQHHILQERVLSPPTTQPASGQAAFSAHLSAHCATCKWKQLPVESVSLWTATKKQMGLFCLRGLQCHVATFVIKTVEKLLLDCSVCGWLRISDFFDSDKTESSNYIPVTAIRFTFSLGQLLWH